MIRKGPYQNYINGEFVSSSSGNVIACLNPATEEVLGYAQKSTVEEARYAIDCAAAAFSKTDWRFNASLREKALYEYANVIEAHQAELAELLTLNNGKTIGESMGEIASCVDGLRYYGGLARNVYGKSVIPSQDCVGVLVREPVGVIGIISPYNWPNWLMIRGLAPALAAGNAVVVKPASLTAVATMAMIDLLSEVKSFPAGIINVLTGSGEEVGDALVKSPKVGVINFTGDASTGESISVAAAPTFKRLALELGGKSPNVVFEDADFTKAVPGAIWAFLYTSGQLCMAGTRLILQDTIYDSFLEELKRQLLELKVGPGIDPSVQVGPLVSRTQYDKVMRLLESGKKDGRLLVGGGRPVGAEFAKGYYIEPTVIVDLPEDAELVQKEVFGPVLAVQKFHTEEEAIHLANCTQYGLAGAVWTRDINRAVRVAERIESGTVWVNAFNKFYTEAEFGGYKASGIGRAHGMEALYECTELKHINIDIKPTF